MQTSRALLAPKNASRESARTRNEYVEADMSVKRDESMRVAILLNKDERDRNFANHRILFFWVFSAGNRPVTSHERGVLIFDCATIDPIAVYVVWPRGLFNVAQKFHLNLFGKMRLYAI